MPNKLDELYSAIEHTIIGNLQHKYYDRTVNLAIKYKQLITGEDIDSLMHQFVRREDDDAFKQRKRLTQQITPAVTAALMNPFYKVGRTNNITKKIDFKEGKDGKIEKLFNVAKDFWGEKTLDDYLETRFTELSFSDPNAFIVTEFDQQPDENGNMTELPKPRAFEVPSCNVINFEYINNALQWLIIRLPIFYNEGDKTVAGSSYTIYGPDYSLKFQQTGLEGYGEVPIKRYYDVTVFDGQTQRTITLFRSNEKDIFIVEEYNHKSKVVPAIRVGYKNDLYTEGAICVNPFHDAMPYLMKSIKTVSEFDLTMCLHAFPQKFAYAPRCTGENAEKSCSHGKTPDGETCSVCKGTGVSVHTTAQDSILLRMPLDKESMIDLSKLVYYAAPTIDIVKFQNEYIQQLKNETKQAVFNSEIFSQTEVVATATEKKISMESVYDTLYPYAVHFSDVYKNVLKVSSYYVDIPDAVIIHKFPKDFKFKTIAELLAELKLANDSNAPGFIRKEISNDLAEAQFIDKPEDLKKIRAKTKHYPFNDKTDSEIIYIISNSKTTNFNVFLWANFDNIFTEIEEDENVGPDFYELTYAKQRAIVAERVNAMITMISGEQPKEALPFGKTGEEDLGGA